MAKRSRLTPPIDDGDSIDSTRFDTDLLLDTATASTYFNADAESVAEEPLSTLVTEPIIKLVAAAEENCAKAAQLHCDTAGSSSSTMTQHLTPSTSTGEASTFNRKRRRIGDDQQTSPTSDQHFRTPPRNKSRFMSHNNAEPTVNLRQRSKRHSPHRSNPPQASLPSLLTTEDNGAATVPPFTSTSAPNVIMQEAANNEMHQVWQQFEGLPSSSNWGLLYPTWTPSRPQIVPNESLIRTSQLNAERAIEQQLTQQMLQQQHLLQMSQPSAPTNRLNEMMLQNELRPSNLDLNARRPPPTQNVPTPADLQAYQASVAQESLYQQHQLAFHQAIIQQLLSQVQMLTSNITAPNINDLQSQYLHQQPQAAHEQHHQQQQAMQDLLYISAPQINHITAASSFEQRPHVHIYTNGLGTHWANFTDADTLIAIAEHMAAAAAHAYHRMPKGLNKAQIDLIPSYRWSTASVENVNCVVCMCDVMARQTVRQLPCTHIYHVRCIDKWLKTNRTCPVCRHDASKPKDGKEEASAETSVAAVAGPSTRA